MRFKKYAADQPCPHCHSLIRYVADDACVLCTNAAVVQRKIQARKGMHRKQGDAAPRTKKTRRKCLGKINGEDCGRWFWSTGPGNWICPRHASNSARHTGLPDGWEFV